MIKNKKITLIFSMLFLFACQQKGSGTETGNPIQTVTLKSSTYVNTLNKITTQSTISDFKFCITQIALEDTSANSLSGSGIEVDIGVVDLSNAATDVVWGDINIPTNFELSLLTVEIHLDPEKCPGTNYSLSYQATELTTDLEFKFRFNPPVQVNANDVFVLGLSEIASALEAAKNAGKLNDLDVKDYLDATVEGTGEEQN